jgi:hypothetical protein
MGHVFDFIYTDADELIEEIEVFKGEFIAWVVFPVDGPH